MVQYTKINLLQVRSGVVRNLLVLNLVPGRVTFSEKCGRETGLWFGSPLQAVVPSIPQVAGAAVLTGPIAQLKSEHLGRSQHLSKSQAANVGFSRENFCSD